MVHCYKRDNYNQPPPPPPPPNQMIPPKKTQTLLFIAVIFSVVLISNSLVIDNPPYEFTLDSVSNYNLLYEINDYENVTIVNSTFSDCTFHINSTKSLFVHSNVFHGRKNPFRTLGILNVNKVVVENNIFYGVQTPAVISPPEVCFQVPVYVYFNGSSNTTFQTHQTPYDINSQSAIDANISLVSNTTNTTLCVFDTSFVSEECVKQATSEIDIYYNGNTVQIMELISVTSNELRLETQNTTPSSLVSFMRIEPEKYGSFLGFVHNRNGTQLFSEYALTQASILATGPIVITNNTIRRIVVDPFVMPYGVSTYGMGGNTPRSCESHYRSYDFNQTYYTHLGRVPIQDRIEVSGFWFDFDRVTFGTISPLISNVNVSYNRFETIGTSTSHQLHVTPPDYLYDSLVKFRIGTSAFSPSSISYNGGLSVVGNTMETLGLGILKVTPIRVTVLYTQIQSLAHLLTILPLGYTSLYGGGTPNYQFAPHMINKLNYESKPYQFITQIERNSTTDDFNGWDEGHYACKLDCTMCHLTQNSFTPEFSIHTDGVTFNRQVFANSTRATRLCRHETLSVTTPATITQASVFSSKNKVNGVLNIRPNYLGGVLRIMISDVSGMPEEHYKHSFDRQKYQTNSEDQFFVSNHPNLIIPKETYDFDERSKLFTLIPERENAKLQNLTFRGVRFTIASTGVNNKVFSFVAHASGNAFSVPSSLNILSFEDCTFDTSSLVYKQASAMILNNTDVYTTYTHFVSKIEDFIFVNNTIANYGHLVSGIDGLHTTRAKITHNTMSNMQTGFITVFTKEYAEITNNVCDNGCSVGGPNSAWLSVYSTNENNGYISQITHNSFVNTLLSPTGGLANRIYQVTNFNNVTLSQNNASGIWGVGMAFASLGNHPCSFITFVRLQLKNPFLRGVDFNFYCEPQNIGCRGDNCYDDISLAPPYCIVDPTYPTDTDEYKIKYFSTFRSALLGCLAYHTRTIYYVSGVYHETALPIKNKNTLNESLQLLPLVSGTSAIIIGAEHNIQSTISLFNLTLEGLIFFNPLGVQSYITGVSPFMIGVSNTNLHSFVIRRSTLYNIKPYVPIALPVTNDMATWLTFLNTLITTPIGVHPYIREPSVSIAININLGPGRAEYTDLYLYGSSSYGITETRLGRGETSIQNVHGENMFSSFIYARGQYDIVVNGTTCNYFCGGLTTQSQAALLRVGMTNNEGVRMILEGNSYIVGQLPAGNIYVPVRLPYGNPFIGFLNIYAGRLFAVWIENLSGSNFVDFKWRRNTVRGWQGCLRGTNSNSNRTIHEFNFQTIVLEDQKILARQLVSDNDPASALTSMDCTYLNVKFGNSNEDEIRVPQSNNCAGLCLPPITQLLCTVDLSQPISSQNYHTIASGIYGCPFPQLVVVTNPHYENVATNFLHTPVRTSKSMTVLSYQNVIVYGLHTFTQNCAPSDVVSTDITFKNLQFLSPLNMITSPPPTTISAIFDFVGSNTNHPQCNFTSVTFDNSPIIMSNLSQSALLDGIRCDQCNVESFVVKNTVVTGRFRNGLKFDTQLATTRMSLRVNKVTIQTSTQHVASLVFPSGVGSSIDLQEIVGRCENSVSTPRCLYIYGAALSGARKISNNQIYANEMIPSTLYTGIVWELGVAGVLTLPQIQDVLNETKSNTVRATQFGLQIISNNVQSFVPCGINSNIPIKVIRSNNQNIRGAIKNIVITDNGGIVVGYIVSITPNIQCLSINDIISVDDPIVTVFIVSGLAIFIFVFFVIWWCDCCKLWYAIRESYVERGNAANIKRNRQEYQRVKTKEF